MFCQTRKKNVDMTLVGHRTELTKTKKPGHKADIITLMAFTPDIRLCVYHCLEEYIQRTEKLRSDDGQLFISFNKPHNKVSRETLRRWIKNVMVLAGIDVNIFTSDAR